MTSPSHLRSRGHQEVPHRLPLRRPPDGHAARLDRCLSTFYPDSNQINDPVERYLATIRLIAKMPTLRPSPYRHNMGLPYVYPDNDLSYLENFLSMMFKMTEAKYGPDPAFEGDRRALHPSRRPRAELLDQRRARVGSSDVDPYSAVAAGIAALRPPRRRQRGGAADAAPDREGGQHPGFLEAVKNRERS